ncbi:glycosyltransferase family 2 protein [Desulfobacter sp.]|uniref:glycosyltransferase family 2 protein n=1 Tax=Desulfobacter sp. TaxID=2294 RepID=UPI000E8758C2|nr:glycosyltransferase family 2 protein [Desulfobacter sp.]HBT86975.1 cellulose synthase catalytic subunit (UDP-forming) [Desulfobacter sp.]
MKYTLISKEAKIEKQSKNKTKRIRENLAGGLSILIIGGYLLLSSAYLSLFHQALLGGLLVVIAGITSMISSHTGKLSRILIMTICSFLTLRYLQFRINVSLAFNGVPDMIAALMLFSAEVYGIVIYFFGMFVNAWPLDRRSVQLPVIPSDYPTVDVYIPTYNEPVELLRITALAATQMLYPEEKRTIYILDDGGTKQRLDDANKEKAQAARERSNKLKQIASELSVIYATRDKNLSAKAGNLNEALLSCECSIDEDAFDGISCVNHGIQQGCGDLILILDCDHVPTRDFLENTVGFFLKDPNLFLLQTPHYFINPDPLEKNLNIFRKSPSENEMFYGAIHPGLDFWNASFFCGSAAILRRKYLMETGGIAGNSITEDAETALGLHAKGYSSAYLKKPLIIGLTPETFSDFIIQRSRWAQGMIQIFILKNPLLQKGLSVPQRICYFNATLFWFFGIARIIFYLSPLVLLFFGLRIYNASWTQVLAYALPHLMGAHILSNFLFGRFRHPFFSELYETIQSIYLLPAILSAIIKPRAPVFKVTPKAVSHGKDFLSHLSMPFYLMLVISAAGSITGIYRIIRTPEVMDAILICMAWNLFNMVLLLACLGVVWEKRQLRKQHRYETCEKVTLEYDHKYISGTIFDLSVSGAGIRVNNDAGLGVKDHLVLHVKDSRGEAYQIPVIIEHIIFSERQLKLGCSFVTDTLTQLTAVVNFVYGDSNRWKFYGQYNQDSRIGNFLGFLNLLKIGVSGFMSNFKGVSSLVYQGIKVYIHHIYRLISKHREDLS